MTTIQTAGDKRLYVEQFERLERELAGSEPAAVRHLRLAAIARFDQIGFPTSRNEDWRFTSVADLLKVPFHPAPRLEDSVISEEDLEPFGFGEAVHLVFVNGRLIERLSRIPPLGPGVVFGSLADALVREPERLTDSLGRVADFKDQTFTALNSAFFRDGAVLVIPDGVAVEPPIHLLHVALGGAMPWVSYPRNLIVLGRGSRANVIESWIGLPLQTGQEPTFTAAVTEVLLAADAVLDHVRIQREDRQAFHFSNLAASLGASARFTTHLVSLGGGWVRNESRVRFGGQNAEATVNGLYFGRGTQHVDNHTVIDHALPHCASHELYKGILDDRARGVFNGKIFVRQDAQKTDAKQTNQTLLLSDDAVINTKPQLEIFADDVKCTHGATVGNLNEDALFYLRSRGLDVTEARALLTYAFANDILNRIAIAPVQQRLEALLLSRSGPLQEAQS